LKNRRRLEEVREKERESERENVRERERERERDRGGGDISNMTWKYKIINSARSI
jgi:hypothetical protein